MDADQSQRSNREGLKLRMRFIKLAENKGYLFFYMPLHVPRCKIHTQKP